MPLTPNEEREAASIVAELHAVGVDVRRLHDVADRQDRYRPALPVLLDWLPRVESDRNRESIVRALGKAWARPTVNQALVDAFRTTSDDGLRWVIGLAIEATWHDRWFDDVVALVQDAGNGSGRRMAVSGLGKSKRPDAVQVLLGLTDDDDVRNHAITALARLRAPAAISVFLDAAENGPPWVRTASRRALGRLDALPPEEPTASKPTKRLRPRRGDDWYRSAEWNDTIAAAFEAELARSRSSRREYLRIQGGTLALRADADEAIREAGRTLLRRYMAECAEVGQSPALVNGGGEALATSLALSGRLHEAVDEYRHVLRRVDEDGSDSFTTGMAEVLLAEVLIRLGDDASLAEADVLLTGFEPEMRRTAFFRDRVVRYLTARARVASRQGRAEDAADHARRALAVLAVEEAPLPRHPGVGVPADDPERDTELHALAEPRPSTAKARRRVRSPFRRMRP
ncbi:HEAT repeat domain-containing protein [Curtobacterium sp. VKM Ac-1393]|uniref:HEAT repeat domain-containing protein n=1 Tax=Curtobacterium sp. VKM Ac-1393 TaxID=2783814 RepID=UPI00188C6057|nr:HEAT repeat domain-containing protein [Curtobacterium sp. VKM Ac-1393]MBF4607788.1 HEAT repeat domain-containing protein [Curtobacterium sp. VKM Ac-1393]